MQILVFLWFLALRTQSPKNIQFCACFLALWRYWPWKLAFLCPAQAILSSNADHRVSKVASGCNKFCQNWNLKSENSNDFDMLIVVSKVNGFPPHCTGHTKLQSSRHSVSKVAFGCKASTEAYLFELTRALSSPLQCTPWVYYEYQNEINSWF